MGFASGTCHFEELSFGSGDIGGNSKLPGEGSDNENVTGEEPGSRDSGGNDESESTEGGSGEEESSEGEEPSNGDSGEPDEETPEEPIKTSIVSGAEATGGILGAGMFSENDANESMTFINCVNHGAITVDGAAKSAGTETGGIAGYIYHASNEKTAKVVFENCKNHGTIEGNQDYTAGIVARIGSARQYIVAEITNSSNNGSVKGEGSYCWDCELCSELCG